MNNLNFELEKRAAELQRMQAKLRQCLGKAPEGTLRVSCIRGKPHFYHRRNKADRTGKYLNAENTRLIAQLAQKDNDERELRAVEEELEAIREYFARYPAVSLEEVYGKLRL